MDDATRSSAGTALLLAGIALTLVASGGRITGRLDGTLAAAVAALAIVLVDVGAALRSRS